MKTPQEMEHELRMECLSIARSRLNGLKLKKSWSLNRLLREAKLLFDGFGQLGPPPVVMVVTQEQWDAIP